MTIKLNRMETFDDLLNLHNYATFCSLENQSAEFLKGTFPKNSSMFESS